MSQNTPNINRPRVMINPSCQYGNQIFDELGCEVYNEGHNMWHYATAVKRYLDVDGRLDSYISRDGERDDSNLDKEADLTNSLKCDCLVALHSDATADGSIGGGTWTFYTGKDHLSDEELASLPYQLSDSFRLAELVQGHVLSAVVPIYREHINRGVKQHWNRLRMLHKPQCPSCLIEILFHSNPVEREMLKDEKIRNLVGKAIADAILEYFFGR